MRMTLASASGGGCGPGPQLPLPSLSAPRHSAAVGAFAPLVPPLHCKPNETAGPGARSNHHPRTQPAAQRGARSSPACSLGVAGHARAWPSVRTGVGALHLPCSPVRPIPPLLPPLLPLFGSHGLCPRVGQAHTPLHSAQPQLSPLLSSCCRRFHSSPGPCWLRTLREGNSDVISGKKHHLLLLSLPSLSWDPFAHASARPSPLLACREPRRFGSKGGTGQGSVTLEGSRSLHPTAGSGWDDEPSGSHSSSPAWGRSG